MNWRIEHCTARSRSEPWKVRTYEVRIYCITANCTAAPETLPFDRTDGGHRAGDERRALVGLNQLLDLTVPPPINSSVWSTN
jgi:hypothetical protein